MIEQIKVKQLENTFLKLTEANMFYILGLVEGLRHAQGTGNDEPLVKENETINYLEHDINDVC